MPQRTPRVRGRGHHCRARAPPPCSMPTRVPAPLRSLEWTPEPPLIPHSPPHSLCTPAPLSALLFERPPWTRCGAPWPTSNHHPAAPTNFVLLFLASRCSSAPSPRSRGHLQTAAVAGNAILARLCYGAAASCSQPRPGPGAATAVHGQAPARLSVAADASPASQIGHQPAAGLLCSPPRPGPRATIRRKSRA